MSRKANMTRGPGCPPVDANLSGLLQGISGFDCWCRRPEAPELGALHVSCVLLELLGDGVKTVVNHLEYFLQEWRMESEQGTETVTGVFASLAEHAFFGMSVALTPLLRLKERTESFVELRKAAWTIALGFKAAVAEQLKDCTRGHRERQVKAAEAAAQLLGKAQDLRRDVDATRRRIGQRMEAIRRVLAEQCAAVRK